MIGFIQRIKNKLPLYKYNVWYNLAAHSRNSYPLVFNEHGEYIDCTRGLKVVMGLTDSGDKIWYKVTKMWHERPWADWLYPSDAIHCNMKFSHIERVKLVNK